jgi:DNA-binding HxlR family transcriptional regulator
MHLSECPVRAAIDVIEGKWKPIIINALKSKPLRFGQLRRETPEATKKVLTAQLRELEKDEVICRKNFGEPEDHLRYALTTYGRTLVPILARMAKWGALHKALHKERCAGKRTDPRRIAS